MIPYGQHDIDKEDVAAVLEVLRKGPITQGPLSEKFGAEIANYCGARYGLAVSSGTAGLQLATNNLDLRCGEEVITTPLTFCATANSVILAGGEVRFVDVEANTLNIDYQQIEDAITPKTKAIIPVDFRGHPANLGEIKSIADRFGLRIVEDAAHSLGSNYQFAGATYKCGDCKHADVAICSFHPVKHITTGEGGVVLTNSKDTYERLKGLRSHGLVRNTAQNSAVKRVGSWVYDLEEVGFNFRLSDLQAALGLSQLKKLEAWKKRRREIVNYYLKNLECIEEVRLPFESKEVDSNFHIFTIQILPNTSFDRYDVFQEVQQAGYAPMVHYIPLSRLSFYKARYDIKREMYPNAEGYYDRALTLPLYPSMKDTLVEKVVSDFTHIIGRLRCSRK